MSRDAAPSSAGAPRQDLAAAVVRYGCKGQHRPDNGPMPETVPSDSPIQEIVFNPTGTRRRLFGATDHGSRTAEFVAMQQQETTAQLRIPIVAASDA